MRTPDRSFATVEIQIFHSWFGRRSVGLRVAGSVLKVALYFPRWRIRNILNVCFSLRVLGNSHRTVVKRSSDGVVLRIVGGEKAFDRGGPVWPPRSNAKDERLRGGVLRGFAPPEAWEKNLRGGSVGQQPPP